MAIAPLKVAVLGPEGTFSHQCAAKNYSGYEPCFRHTLTEVLEAVKRREADIALVPLENSNSGSIKEIQKEMFSLAGQLFISNFCYHHIDLHLFSFESSLESIVEVRSKDAALAQCEVWLNEHLPSARRSAVSSTAAAVRGLDREHLGVAALGSTDLKVHGVPTLAESIQSEPNVTLFCEVVRDIPADTFRKARFALLGLPDFTEEKFGKLLKALENLPSAITHNWVIEDMDNCPPNTGIFEVGILPQHGMIDAVLAAVRNELPQAFLAGAYFSLGFSEFSNIKHAPYAPGNFDY